jgi:hypothetical protein
MRRLTAVLLAAALCASLGCRRKGRLSVETVEEGDTQLVSVIHAADPRSATQLVRGFYDIEQNSWRWTMGKFSVALRPPAGAARNGAVLQVRLAVPDPVIEKLKSVTLTPSINGVAIDPETYSKPGEYVFTRDIPPSSLAGDAVTVDFALDKFLAAGMVEQRELGVVVTLIGLLPK